MSVSAYVWFDLSLLFLLIGFFGWFGVATCTRRRRLASVFYAISTLYGALFLSLLSGVDLQQMFHLFWLLDCVAVMGLLYIIAIEWTQHRLRS